MRRLAGAALLAAVLAAPAAAGDDPADYPPVVLVHGIDDTPAVFAPLVPALARAGHRRIRAVALVPNDGGLPLSGLARQLVAQTDAFLAETGAPRCDVVAFSMGSVISRYALQRLGLAERTRRFVAIAGPQQGTATAYLRWNPGAADMRFGSALLNDLNADAAALTAKVPTTVIWTPLDLMIVPAWSSRLPGAAERLVPAIAHPLLLGDRGAQRAIVEALR